MSRATISNADLLANLLKTGTAGNQKEFLKVATGLIERERQKGHLNLAERLQKIIQQQNRSRPVVQSIDHNKNNLDGLYFRQIPDRSLDDLSLPVIVKKQIQELVHEQHSADVLRSYNLKPRNRILLAGEPGNGKTSLAGALAYELMVPLLTVRYDTLIGSYLGETGARLNKLFAEVRNERCVLFFDEFETLGKERADAQETGEIKRVVSALLLHIDDLPDYVVAVAATNHHELLDKAVWRRFQLKLELPSPTYEQLVRFISTVQKRSKINFGYPPKVLAKELLGHNYAEAEEFCLGVVRTAVLAGCISDAKKVTKQKLEQWHKQLRPL